jgi:hypothetical protein
MTKLFNLTFFIKLNKSNEIDNGIKTEIKTYLIFENYRML